MRGEPEALKPLGSDGQRAAPPTNWQRALTVPGLGEFGWLWLLAAAGAVAPLVEAPTAVRIVLGLPLVTFIPGYALVAALFPSTTVIDTVERLSLSFALSLALIPLLALAVDLSPWSFALAPMLVALLAATVLFSIIALVRRSQTASVDRFLPVVPDVHIPPPRAWDTLTRVAVATAVAGLVLFLGSGALLVAQRLGGEPMTEFALYNADGNPEFYARFLHVGEPASYVIEIVNHEQKTVTYTLRVTTDGQELGRIDGITVADGEIWRQPVQIAIPVAGSQVPVTFDLFRQDRGTDGAPYRQLRIFVDVTPVPSTG